MNITRAPVRIVRSISAIDILIFLGLVFAIYALIGVAKEWTGPFQSKTAIDLSLWALPQYAFFSLVRGFVAYFFSLVVAISYGYLAAHSKPMERVLIALLDILQSVPVLAFLPGVVLSLVTIFPDSNIGLEVASIFMIFNGQVWNMIFSFYGSVKGVPAELREVSRIYGFSRWDSLRKVEIPYAMNGLLWNSMLSMAGGWFFLMVAESFTLGERDFRLPGIGSYISVAYELSNRKAMVAGLIAMLCVIIIVDRLLWAPLVAWSERFRMETLSEEEGDSQFSWAAWMKRSMIVRLVTKISNWIKRQESKTTVKTIRERKAFSRAMGLKQWSLVARYLKWAAAFGGGLVLVAGAHQLLSLLVRVPMETWSTYFQNTFFTVCRVMGAVLLGSLWTIPLGVWIGTHPVWTRRLQPLVQITASFPYPMVFPLVTSWLLYLGIGMEIGSTFLMVFGSQWYILFNVISGATQIPRHLLEVASVFKIRGVKFWTAIILPSIFPALVGGWITAAGGAWNASIVSEFVQRGADIVSASGIGASITLAALRTDFPALAAAVVTMVTTVVLINRFFWGSLYQLAETKYRLDSVGNS